MRRPSRKGKYVINSEKVDSPVSRFGRVTKARYTRTSTPVKAEPLLSYIRESDGLARNVKPPTRSFTPLAAIDINTEQRITAGSHRLDSTHWWVMSSAPEKSPSPNQNGQCKPRGHSIGDKLKRKDSKKEKKSGKKSEKESQSFREKGASAGGSSRRSRSRKKTLGLFSCTGGQRSRSCTPERNATLSCRLPVSLDLESLDLQLAEIMAKQRDFSREYVCRQEPEERQCDDREDAENPKTSLFNGFRRLSFRRRKSVTKSASMRTQCKGKFNPNNDRQDMGRDTVSTSSADSGISSTENSINRRRDSEKGARSLVPFSGQGDSLFQSPCAGVRMGTKGLERRANADTSVPLPETSHLPLRNRPLPQPCLIRTNINVAPPKQDITLVKTIHLDKVLKHKWISGISITKKYEYVIVDMREAYLLDEEGGLKRTIGGKGNGRLFEPISVSALTNGNLIFSDHSEQDVKVYNNKGHFLGRVQDKGLTNIAGVTASPSCEIFIAGTDKRRVSVHSESDQLLYTIPADGQSKSIWEHPYSIAINPLTGDLLVGDDNKQLVTAVTRPEGKLLWKFSPVGNRHFFPSSICADENGYVFIADLYNEKVYMLDSGGKYIKTILSRGAGLKGGPGAIAVDGRGHLVVADEERTLKVFKYGENGFTMYRRTSQYSTAN